MSEFETAVANTRAGDACPTKMYPSAAGGATGGAGSHGSEVDAQAYIPAQSGNFKAGTMAGGCYYSPTSDNPDAPGGGALGKLK